MYVSLYLGRALTSGGYGGFKVELLLELLPHNCTNPENEGVGGHSKHGRVVKDCQENVVLPSTSLYS
jgi:hypothetical protein